MYKQGGVFAILAALAAAPHLTPQKGTKPIEHSSHAISGTVEPQPSEERLLGTFRDFTDGGDFRSPVGKNGACLVDPRAKLPFNRAEMAFHWAIATVPDPEHSHSMLDFDRDVESIENAAQELGFDPERYWFPWRTEDDTAEKTPDSYVLQHGAKQKDPWKFQTGDGDSTREQLPGVLLFRVPASQEAPASALAIFLVAETPTSGIDPAQFHRALCYGSSLPRPPGADRSELRILGPGFSGSFHSLTALLKDAVDKYRFKRLIMRTWTQDYKSQNEFAERSGFPALNLRTTQAGSIFSINNFIGHVRGELEDKNPIVLLVEEGTAFGGGINIHSGESKTDESADKEGILREISDDKTYTLYFPRNISTLRSATENDTHLPGFGDDSKRADLPHNGLTVSLKGDEHASADVPVYAKQTAASEESALFSIGSLLKTNSAHYVGIVASNTLDALFLSRYLHSACPNLRIFTLGSDLLFEHGTDSSDFEGVLAITTAPLFPFSQLWTGSRSTHSLYAFPSSVSEAVYNATGSLLTFSGNGEGSVERSRSFTDKTFHFRDYEEPFEADTAKRAGPALWLTVASRNGYQPVDILTQHSVPYRYGDDQAEQQPMFVPVLWSGWAYTLALLIFLCAGYAFVLICATATGRRSLALFSVKAEEHGACRRAFYLSLMGCCLSVLVALWLVVPAVIVNQQVAKGCDPMLFTMHDLVACMLAGVAVMLLAWTFHRAQRPSCHPVTGRVNHPKYPVAIGQSPITVSCSLALAAVCLLSAAPAHCSTSPVIEELSWIARATAVTLGFILTAALAPLGEVLACQAGKARAAGGSKFGITAVVKLFERDAFFWCSVGLIALTLCVSGGAAKAAITHAGPQRFFAACRALDLTGGVSALVPATLLLLSLLAMAFVHLRRIVSSEDRCPQVPDLEVGSFCPRLKETVAEITQRAHSLPSHPAYVAAGLGLALVMIELFVMHGSKQTLEDRELDRLILFLTVACGFCLVMTWIRFLLVWSAFSELLQQLERSPLRNVFSLLPRGFVWSPVWQGNGKKRTHVVLTRSVECLQALQDHPRTDPAFQSVFAEEFPTLLGQVDGLLTLSASRQRIPAQIFDDIEKGLSNVASKAAKQLIDKSWRKGSYESKAVLAQKEETKQALGILYWQYEKEEPNTIYGELVAFRFLSFINYVLLQLDNLVSYLSFGFLLLVVALNSYVFRSRTIIDWALAGLFVILTVGVVAVFAQADRDAILSRITGTEEGKLDRHFFKHVVSFGAMPALLLAATHFPTIGKFFFSWVKPALDAIH